MTIRISDFSRGTSQSNVKPKLSPTRDRYPLTDGISLKMSEILGSLRRHRDTKKTPPPPGFCSVPSCLCGSIFFKSWIRLCRVGLSCIHSVGPRSTNERTETNWCRAGACRHAASFSRKAARRRATALHSIASLRLRVRSGGPSFANEGDAWRPAVRVGNLPTRHKLSAKLSDLPGITFSIRGRSGRAGR